MCSSPLGVYPTSLSFWGSDGQRKKKAIARFISLFMLTIANFAPHRIVITSKKRPSKLTIHGSDEEDYAFLLKGHEDLRQDEFVMQLNSSDMDDYRSSNYILCGTASKHQGCGWKVLRRRTIKKTLGFKREDG
ncbi:DNA-dependent protein kinase catalytic subunit-like isoform X3 [Zingiber officinale]|uniref:DNA-dependent protein kinase catalytic subunit-like isoform X3 n=1 Tax=Zingiber officinale TaxID=94328 RepID=UPI001C4C99EE|nr:DNA-dependent protein kinase catalytic subunit-like isoform X3 [Zingiber officinale]